MPDPHTQKPGQAEHPLNRQILRTLLVHPAIPDAALTELATAAPTAVTAMLGGLVERRLVDILPLVHRVPPALRPPARYILTPAGTLRALRLDETRDLISRSSLGSPPARKLRTSVDLNQALLAVALSLQDTDHTTTRQTLAHNLLLAATTSDTTTAVTLLDEIAEHTWRTRLHHGDHTASTQLIGLLALQGRHHEAARLCHQALQRGTQPLQHALWLEHLGHPDEALDALRNAHQQGCPHSATHMARIHRYHHPTPPTPSPAASGPTLTITTTRPCPQHTHIAIAGEIDYATVAHLRTAIDTEAHTPTRHITLNLADVTLLDSTGIGVLVVAHRICRQRHIHLTIDQPGTHITRTLHAVGVLELLQGND
ncbi:hypothetical protein Lfu02_49890 [Longispora fulva]|uniref:Anti-anti-sigma factor n=1 Tax=Longispora fulva TaxID=619741 RepID=A0A8J7GMN7_9ACTN|nr:STAS domain-containing protein [Longispora fulva]MBG6138365.1 anti-anti-sigma factor [Longispora fulva]GIG60617.1 hypothetical protein Lfu02_49890 [Longispora fulva]